MTQHTEPTRADILAFCEETWSHINERAVAQGKLPDRYEMTRIERAQVGDRVLFMVSITQYYQLLGTERVMFPRYILQQSPHTGALQFVLWDDLKEEEKQDKRSYEEIETEIQELREEEERQAE